MVMHTMLYCIAYCIILYCVPCYLLLYTALYCIVYCCMLYCILLYVVLYTVICAICYYCTSASLAMSMAQKTFSVQPSDEAILSLFTVIIVYFKGSFMDNNFIFS